MAHRMFALVTLVLYAALVAGCCGRLAFGTRVGQTPAVAPSAADAALPATPSSHTTAPEDSTSSGMAKTPAAAPTLIQAMPTPAGAPAFALAAELPWQPVYCGDPLRLMVRLSSPRAMQDAYRAISDQEGQDSESTTIGAPDVPVDWFQGLDLTLYHVDADGTRTEVLADSAWAPHQRQTHPSLPAVSLVTWSQEWFVPAEIAQLQEGGYLLAASWDGHGLDRTLLGPDGIVMAEELRFAVQAPTSDGERATQAGRLAYNAYVRGDYPEARTHGEEALELGVEDGSPDRLDTHFLVAGACFGMKDYPAAIAAYERIIALPAKGHHLADLAQQWIDVINEMQGGR